MHQIRFWLGLCPRQGRLHHINLGRKKRGKKRRIEERRGKQGKKENVK